MRRRHLSPRRGRCVCGLLVARHFTADNRKLSCEDARRLHPRATVRRVPLIESLHDSFDTLEERRGLR